MTPYELWHGKKPSVAHLRIFGCHAHVKKLGPGINKLADRSTPGVMMGYEEGVKAYRIYDPVAKKQLVSREVLFEETRPWNWTAEAAKESTPSGVFTVVYTTEPGVTMTDCGSSSPWPASAEMAPGMPEPFTPPVQFVSPPSCDDALDTDSGHPRYRRVSNVYDTTKETTGEIDYIDFFDDELHRLL